VQVFRQPEELEAIYSRLVGSKLYELTDHLGNVHAVVTDRRVWQGTEAVPEIYSITDYYPFGSERNSTVDGMYRFGFNGKERDIVGLGGSTYDYGFRIYNPQIGKFLSVDPLTSSYPWYTPYQYAGNNPIVFIDLDGLERMNPQVSQNKKKADLLKKKTAKEIQSRQNDNRPDLKVILSRDTKNTRVVSGVTGQNFLNGDQPPVNPTGEKTHTNEIPFTVSRDIDAGFQGDNTVSTAVSNIFEGNTDIPEGGIVKVATLKLIVEVADDAEPQTLRVKQGNFEIGPMGGENPMSGGGTILELKDQTGIYEITIPLKNIDPNTSFSVEFEGGNNQNVKVSGSIELSGTIEQ